MSTLCSTLLLILVSHTVFLLNPIRIVSELHQMLCTCLFTFVAFASFYKVLDKASRCLGSRMGIERLMLGHSKALNGSLLY